MPYCDDCGRHVYGSHTDYMLDDDGNCWRCSDEIDVRGN